MTNKMLLNRLHELNRKMDGVLQFGETNDSGWGAWDVAKTGLGLYGGYRLATGLMNKFRKRPQFGAWLRKAVAANAPNVGKF